MSAFALRVTALSAALFAAPAQAQLSALPAEAAEQVRALGPVIDPPKTGAIFAPFQQKEPYEGVAVKRDIAYGPDERNKLDVFTPEKADGTPRPVIIFVHGGAYVAGNKRTGTSPFYDNIMLAAVKNGFVGVNMTYRLAPAHPYPAATEDLSKAVQWVLENIAANGGDPSRVFLWGQSAGGAHAGNYIAHTQFHGPKGIGIKGAILMSGIFDQVAYPSAPNVVAYFGEDRSKYEERSSLKGIVASKLPLLVIDAEIDPPPFIAQSKLLNDALCAAGRCPERITLKGHSHMSEVYSINTADREAIDAVTAFAKKH
ncbi:MAG: alpha/beta hydrolase [Xanthobacteraceae bacterium]|nr:alpha/beta hydrolase [Xanthobacteraceae bacterium]